MANSLTLKQDIPLIQLNEGAELEPIDFNLYIDNPDDVPLRFSASLVDGDPFPESLLMDEKGEFRGYAAADTAKDAPYEVSGIAQGESIEPLFFNFELKITPVAKKTEGDENQEAEKNGLVAYWELFEKGLKLPDIDAILTREVSSGDIYYLLGRFATLIVWNANNLTPADEGRLIQLKGISDQYNVYDFDVAIVATPKDLYDNNRSLHDSIQTAQGMVQEIQRREWSVEFAGYDKMVTAAWVEVQRLNKLGEGYKIDVVGYEPTVFDMEVLMHVLNK